MRIVPLILAVALFMENMDSTVIATSLAAIAADIGSEPIALKLAMTTYLVALAIFIPISSWMADRFGARNVFRAAIVVFVLGSLACAASSSLTTFVLSRFLQGMGGAMMTPVARIVLVRATPRNEFVNAMAWLTIPGLIGPIVGPPFGGFLTTYFSWHWIFLINVPIGLVGIWLVTRYLPEFARNAPRQIDFAGFILAGATFAGIVFGLSVVSLPALPIWVGVVSMAMGVLFGALYIRHARRSDNPILDLRLLRLPLFRTALVSGAFFRFGVGAIPLLLPLMLQVAFGLNAFQSGLITFSSAIGAIGAKFVAESMFERFGFKLVLVWATAVTAAGLFAVLLFAPGTSWALIIGILAVSGFAQSLFWTGSWAFSYAEIDDRDAGQASVITMVWVQITLATGVALGGGVLELSHLVRGTGELTLADFHVAFAVIAVMAAIASLVLMRVPRNAAAHISGQAARREPAE